MDRHYYLTDVFTNIPFSGAQIAVFPEADDIGLHDRALIANELNLWETIFIEKRKSNKATAHFKLSVHTPRKETMVGVHSAVAAAYVLAKTGDINLHSQSPLHFETNGGEQLVYIAHENHEIKQALLTRKFKPSIDRFTPTKEELSEVLGIALEQLYDKHFSPIAVATDNAYLIVPVKSLEALIEATFNYKAWSMSAAPSTFTPEILLFSKDTEQHLPDFHLRLVGPNIGINEDPPIGTAIPCFAAYLCQHPHISTGTHIFAVERGLEKSRQSILHLEMDNKQEPQLTIRVGGAAVLVGEGKIYL